MQLQDTTAIVTGGASGLGAATADALSGAGAKVHVFDLASGPEGHDRSDGVTHHDVDVTDPSAVREAVAEVAAGSSPLRVVVNCAGIGPSARLLGKAGPHDFDLLSTVMAVNLLGTFHVLTLAAEQIARTSPDQQGQRGVVINTASAAAFDGQVGQAAYAASKGAVAALTLPAARDLAQYGIRVMTIAPGILLTPMLMSVSEEFRDRLAEGVPFPARLGDPTEFAALALAVIDNDYLNGEVIRLDGGLRMPPR
jgi:NAD(P)-dependent dehydrogenase (short-subunit alcohol dehydrogenase family)